jgi:hypothetical protein
MSNEPAGHVNKNTAWMRAYFAVAMLPLALGACGGGGGGSPSPAPAPPTSAPSPGASILVTSSATTTTPDGSAIDVTATVSNSTVTPTWTLAGPGTLSAASGMAIQYLPPDSEVFNASGTATLSATIGGGVSQSVSITVTPIVVAGFTWTDVAATSVGNLQAVDYADGRYVAVSDQGSALTSTDAVTWTPTTVFSSVLASDHFDAFALVHMGNTFIAAGSISHSPYTTSTGAVATSTDGVAWTLASTPTLTVPIHSMAVGPQLIALGAGGQVYSSPDGLTWSAVVTLPNLTILNSVAYAAGKFVSVGDGGYIADSTNGTIWLSSQVIKVGGVGVNLHGVAYDGSKFVVVGDNGLIATSPDGSSWTPQTSAITGNLRSVAVSTAGEIVIVGDSGIETSKDAVTWHSRDEGAAATLYDLAFLNGRFVAVGSASAIKTSDH